MSTTIDTARLQLLLAELRLPTIARIWSDIAATADQEGWPAARLLAALAEHEIAARGQRRIERHLADARLPPGKTLDSFDFAAVPMVSKARVMALAAGDTWLEKGIPTCWLLGRQAAGRLTSGRPSAVPWSRTDFACCSPARLISSSASNSPGRSSISRTRSASSTDTTS